MPTIVPDAVDSWAHIIDAHGLPVVISIIALLFAISLGAFIIATLRRDQRRSERSETQLSQELREQHDRLWQYFTVGDGNVSARLASVAEQLTKIREMLANLQAEVLEHGQRLGQGEVRFGVMEERLDSFESILARLERITGGLRCQGGEACATEAPKRVPQPRGPGGKFGRKAQ